MGDKRYEISVLIGPCKPEEAENLLAVVSTFIYRRPDNYGAAIAMREVPDDEK